MTSKKNENGRRPQKIEDDLNNKNIKKWKTTSKKNGRWPQFKKLTLIGCDILLN
jgi:hypothetical protein